MTAQQAINKAIAFLVEIYGDEGARAIRAEELEQDEHDGGWHVTLSYFPSSNGSDFSEAMRSVLTPERIYKTIEVTPSGSVRSMKIRTLQ